MTDLQFAKQNLEGHTISLYKGNACFLSEKRGIAPMMGFIADGIDLSGWCVADIVVGKAAALLFVKCGIAGVYAKTLSESGKKVLEKYNIPCEYETLTERIINRAGTDTCPMEKTVFDTDDPEEAYVLLKNKLQSIG
ncbi:MAG: DUF1893 domain-containing protein [Clostridia bacterium]|nr:DUF1893 domain-containing protein [Clostridia bacterium]